jgi:hypothetical protein
MNAAIIKLQILVQEAEDALENDLRIMRKVGGPDAVTKNIKERIAEYKQAIALLEAAKRVDRERTLWALDTLAEYFGTVDGYPIGETIKQLRALLSALPAAAVCKAKGE